MKIVGYAVVGFLLYVVFQYATLPDVKQIEKCFTTTMNKVDFCSKNKNFVSFSGISPHIRNALIISEDGSFYSHKGIDVDELKKSIETNLKKGKFARGGSTLTQQLAKNLFLTKEKTITRKLKELILTKRIEETYSKNKILETYLNVVEFGEGIYGVKRASEHYFQKHPSAINPLEASFLVFLLPNPKKYAVSFKKKELTRFARSRIQDILYKLSAYKKISGDEYVYYKSQLSTMWHEAPDMENEAEDYATETEPQTLDLNQKIHLEELQEKQNDSIEKLQEQEGSLQETTLDVLEPEAPIEKEQAQEVQ